MDKVNLEEKLGRFDEHWSPKIVGELNGQYVKVAKFLGEFPWHKHDGEDEMFLVLKGRLTIRFRLPEEGGEVRGVDLGEGDFLIVRRGVEHSPICEEEVHALLFEPKSTLNTGDVRNEFTLEELEEI